jgi:DNA-binding IclR family transcriptional regulator
MASGFVLGAALLEIADQVSFATREAALPVMHGLCTDIGETVVLHVVDGDAAVVLAQVASDQILRIERVVGTRDPLHAGASGLALLAFQPPATVRRVLSAAGDGAVIQRKLAEVRRDGYALTRNELGGDIHAIAAPITGRDGQVVASMAVLLPANRGDGLGEHRAALLRAAGEVVVSLAVPRAGT